MSRHVHTARAHADRGVSGEAIAESYDAFEKGQVASPMAHATLASQTIQESMRLMLLVRAHQVSCMCLKHV
jgi:2-oxoglutarate dehydrogenase E1 component